MWRGTNDDGSTGADRCMPQHSPRATRARARALGACVDLARNEVAMSLGAVVTAAVAANRLKRRPSTNSPHTSRNPTGSGHSHDPLTMSFKALGEAEGCGALLAAMSAEPKQVATLTACCTVMAMHAWGNGVCKRGVLLADGAPAILSAMRAHKDQIAVQETGLMALARVQEVGPTMNGRPSVLLARPFGCILRPHASQPLCQAAAPRHSPSWRATTRRSRTRWWSRTARTRSPER
jgi:hypothetical protein